ncbi:hypothetical protein [Dokdonia sp.]|uniref:hypothetical protein n=1 Tax=Dokdonia sp. TaxID=2024995 RepID=UPI003267C314
MKKKKIKLQFDKKVISNLTKIQGGQEIGVGTLSNAPDAQSICLCGPTTDPNNTVPTPTDHPAGSCIQIICTDINRYSLDRRDC